MWPLSPHPQMMPPTEHPVSHPGSPHSLFVSNNTGLYFQLVKWDIQSESRCQPELSVIPNLKSYSLLIRYTQRSKKRKGVTRGIGWIGTSTQTSCKDELLKIAKQGPPQGSEIIWLNFYSKMWPFCSQRKANRRKNSILLSFGEKKRCLHLLIKKNTLKKSQ